MIVGALAMGALTSCAKPVPKLPEGWQPPSLHVTLRAENDGWLGSHHAPFEVRLVGGPPRPENGFPKTTRAMLSCSVASPQNREKATHKEAVFVTQPGGDGNRPDLPWRLALEFIPPEDQKTIEVACDLTLVKGLGKDAIWYWKQPATEHLFQKTFTIPAFDRPKVIVDEIRRTNCPPEKHGARGETCVNVHVEKVNPAGYVPPESAEIGCTFTRRFGEGGPEGFEDELAFRSGSSMTNTSEIVMLMPEEPHLPLPHKSLDVVCGAIDERTGERTFEKTVSFPVNSLPAADKLPVAILASIDANGSIERGVCTDCNVPAPNGKPGYAIEYTVNALNPGIIYTRCDGKVPYASTSRGAMAVRYTDFKEISVKDVGKKLTGGARWSPPHLGPEYEPTPSRTDDLTCTTYTLPGFAPSRSLGKKVRFTYGRR